MIIGKYDNLQSLHPAVSATREFCIKDKVENNTINIGTARLILRTIMFTSEQNIQNKSPLNILNEYSHQQIKEAFVLVAQDIVSPHIGKPNTMYYSYTGWSDYLYKEDETGSHCVQFYLDYHNFNKRTVGDESEIRMFGHYKYNPSGQKDASFYTFGLPLSNPNATNEIERWIMSHSGIFIVVRNDSEEYVGFDSFKQENKLKDRRFAWKGLRWLAANMLFWNTDNIIWLNDLELQYSQTPLILSPQKTIPTLYDRK